MGFGYHFGLDGLNAYKGQLEGFEPNESFLIYLKDYL